MSIYTKEQISRADNMSLVQYAKDKGFELIPNGTRFRIREKDNLYIEDNHWFSYYLGRGGGAVSFLTEIEGIRFPQAVKALTGEEPMGTFELKPIEPPGKAEKRELMLPLPTEDGKALYTYLKRRGISPRVIQTCLDKGLIYQTNMFWQKQEDGTYTEQKGVPQVVFVGMDPENIPRYASMRATFGDGKHEAPGSEKAYAFSVPSEGSPSVWVFESAIDLLSHMTLCGYRDNPPNVHRVSLGGVSPAALYQYLSDHPDIRYVNLALDADKPGRDAVKKITEQLQGVRKVYDHPPKRGKDVNEDLLYIQQQYRERHPKKEPEHTASL